MLELKKKELQIKFGEKVEKMNFPSVRDVREMNKKIEQKQGSELDILVGFLTRLGMTEETANDLEMDHVNTIVKELTSSKK